ncbi:hypothetical protein H4219_004493 [Mycoemilia scoparia]|uniref:DNA-directed RNA polymerase subunit n=1 Tax=Mycoemilia scoparia TaxID=417184 RepID=A0A9W7ZSE3_9FUNG|nr:hypothetical protein H4219_004493 [Mycoemilia scoparia]
MNIAKPVNSRITGVSFTLYTPSEIKAMSVKQIVNPQLLDNLGNPTKGGLYDPALGPFSKQHLCATCSLDHFSCPGHFGHIDLPCPVINTLLFGEVLNLLQGMCFYCHRFKLSRTEQAQFIAMLTLLENGLLAEAMEVSDMSMILGNKKGSSGPKKGAKKGSIADDEIGEETGDGDGMDIEHIDDDGSRKSDAPETSSEFIARIHQFVETKIQQQQELNDGKKSQKYKIMIVNQERSRVIDRFIKRCKKDACSNCRAINPKLRHGEYTKIFKMPLSKKHRIIMHATGMKQPDVLKLDTEDLDKLKKFDNTQAEEDNRLSSHINDNDEHEFAEEDEDDGDDRYDSIDAIPTKTSSKSDLKDVPEFLSPMHIRNHLRLLFTNESMLVQLLFGQKDPDVLVTFKTLEDIQNNAKKGTPRAQLNRLIRGQRSSQQLADMFFIETLPIPPTRYRPPSIMNDEVMENSQNVFLGKILKTCVYLRDLVHGGKETVDNANTGESIAKAVSKGQSSPESGLSSDVIFARIINSWISLQQEVNNLFDSSKNPTLGSRGEAPPPGIRQLLEKKQGLFRMHMMGKRVNYAARSVISPDPNVETCEVGVPPVFAEKLTYPEPVTPYNVKELRRAVINGSKQWPGASHVQHEDGSLTSLERLSYESRVALANQLLTPQDKTNVRSGRSSSTKLGNLFIDRSNVVNKKVFRHLRDGDYVLLNRQPTLHKPSIMAHRVKVLPGERTIRMHYANCNTYNADFDGDEMNMHFPQSETARTEAMMIASTDYQYLKPTDGSPLRGLIMDSIDAGVLLAKRDTFFTREEYMQLLYGAIRPEDEPQLPEGKIMIVPPAIIKPRPMWTGKQLVTTVLLNLTYGYQPMNFRGQCKVPGKYWGINSKEEEHVLVMDGELLTGVLDKSQLGASGYGLVHAIYELYTPQHAGRMLTIISRLLIKFFQLAGFSCRMDDLRLTPEGDKVRRKIIDAAKGLGTEVAYEYIGLKEHAEKVGYNDPGLANEYRKRMEEVLRHDNKLAMLDMLMSDATKSNVADKLLKATLPGNLLIGFPKNRFLVMTSSGAKGSNVNFSQISCCLSQQSLEGRRVPIMVSGKSLPSFVPFDSSARAGGFIADRFLTGLHPQEFYFHCMAGREGLIDTAVKTANSGYLQRCLIKHLEGLRVHYDYSVRDSDGSIVQFHYGEDALDVGKQKYLKKFDFAAANYRALRDKLRPRSAAHVLDDGVASSYSKKVAKKSGKKLNKYDPALSIYNPSRYLGSVSDKFYRELDEYIRGNPDKLVLASSKDKSADAPSKADKDTEIDNDYAKMPTALGQQLTRLAQTPPLKVVKECSSKNFMTLQLLNYMKSLVEPGEVVGLLAAQSIGEPSTQMTLNTFHLAGHGAANVTLGIPRLREIVMTASMTPKTPSMILPLLSSIGKEQAKIIAQSLSKVRMSDIVDYIEVYEKLVSQSAHRGGKLFSGGRTGGSGDAIGRTRQFRIKIQLFPMTELEAEYNLKRKDIEDALSNQFLANMERSIAKDLKKSYKKSTTAGGEEGEGEFDMPDIGVPLSKKSSAANGDDGEDDGTKKSSAGRQHDVDDDDDEVEDDDNVDGDATDSKVNSRRRQKATYDDEESDNENENAAATLEELGDELKALDAAAAAASSKGNKNSHTDSDSEVEDNTGLKNINVREADIIDRFTHVSGYTFQPERKPSRKSGDTDKGSWCEIILEFPAKTPKILMVNIAETVAKMTVVRETPGIDRCLVKAKASEKDTETCLQTEGSSLHSIWERALLPLTNEKDNTTKLEPWTDLERLRTNDIGGMLLTYGVEAARASIQREVFNVFDAYGIGVDNRHIGLVADYMTFEGGYKPFNRTGIQSNVSPFAKMSFETTCKFLTDAVLRGDYDNLNNPSARVVVGQPFVGGTGSFDVLMNL